MFFDRTDDKGLNLYTRSSLQGKQGLLLLLESMTKYVIWSQMMLLFLYSLGEGVLFRINHRFLYLSALAEVQQASPWGYSRISVSVFSVLHLSDNSFCIMIASFKLRLSNWRKHIRRMPRSMLTSSGTVLVICLWTWHAAVCRSLLLHAAGDT